MMLLKCSVTMTIFGGACFSSSVLSDCASANLHWRCKASVVTTTNRKLDDWWDKKVLKLLIDMLLFLLLWSMIPSKPVLHWHMVEMP